jgi:hypothetical protein
LAFETVLCCELSKNDQMGSFLPSKMAELSCSNKVVFALKNGWVWEGMTANS